ncbi:MAG: phospholipase D-like domain-containing protein, partial [Verrucomicrobiota bacterium]|nr:phospholipase D-like domain-containing protein [Verrucomicrobiota bacterium]
MRNPFEPEPPSWPKLLAAAAAGGFATLFVARNFFPDEKRITHQIHADYSACDDVFARTVGQLLGPPLLAGNKVTALQNGDEIFPAMLAGIRSAQRTICLENFLLREGKISDEFADALVERANAGVKVHFLQDAFGCDALHGRAMNMIRRSPVELEIFRFINLSMNYRTHRKLLVIDGKTG